MRWFITDNACGILRRFLRRHGGHRTWNSWCIRLQSATNPFEF